MVSFPCNWGGKILNTLKDLSDLTGYPEDRLKSLVKEKSLTEIIVGSEANYKNRYYPQIVNGILVRNDSEAAKVLEIAESTVVRHRSDYITVQSMYNNQKERNKKSLKGRLNTYISKYYNGSVLDFLKKYNQYNYPISTICGWFERGCDYNKVLKLISRYRYPIMYKGKSYKNDTEVSEAFKIPYEVVQSRRNRGMSFEEVISTPYHPYKGSNRRTMYAEKHGYPYISPDGTVAYNDREMAELCGKKLEWVRNKRRSGWTCEEMYLGDVGVPSSDFKRGTKGDTRSFLLLGKFWYPSLKECLERIGLSSYLHVVNSVDDRNEGIARAFIAFACKNNKGYITPELKIDHLLHIHEGTAYYCCYTNGEVDYLSSIDILSSRMNYLKFDFSLHIYRNNGIYNHVTYAELFYCIGKSSIARKVSNSELSYEDATWEIINSKKHQNPIGYNGRIYSYIGTASNKSKVSNQTVHSRIKSTGQNENTFASPKDIYGGVITVDKWLEGRKVGVEKWEYSSKKDLCTRLGLSVSSVYSRIAAGDTIEDLINRELKKRNLYWVPYASKTYTGINDLCKMLGLSKDRMYGAWKMGKKQNLTFWESLKTYYMYTKELFKKYKEDFTCIYSYGVFYLKDIVISGKEVYYHVILPNNTLRVMSFEDIFRVIVESRCNTNE